MWCKKTGAGGGNESGKLVLVKCKSMFVCVRVSEYRDIHMYVYTTFFVSNFSFF